MNFRLLSPSTGFFLFFVAQKARPYILVPPVVPYESAYTTTSKQIYTAYDHNPDDLGRRVAGMDVLYKLMLLCLSFFLRWFLSPSLYLTPLLFSMTV